MLDCDQWRLDYPTMTFEECRASYGVVADTSSEQICFDWPALELALEDVQMVTEIGGWRGEAALMAFGHFQKLCGWVNYEICEEAVGRLNRCFDKRYTGVPLRFWPWDTDLIEGDLLVANHVLEHMTFAQVEALAPQFAKYELLHFQIPIPLIGGADWTSYDGTHILEVGWDSIHELVEAQGFDILHTHDETFTCRTYSKA